MHTKGPWKTTVMDDEFPPSINVISNVVDSEWVADCGHPDPPENQANARLIAAAPELLESLERHVKMFDMMCGKMNVGNMFLSAEDIAEWNEASIQAETAINKAKEK